MDDEGEKLTQDTIGELLAVSGSVLSIMGAMINNITLNHVLAMKVWMISNPVLLVYFTGVDAAWWNGSRHISTRAIILLYFIFTVSNLYGLWIT